MTSELSQLLGVSANTIRRYAQKGYLSPQVDGDNQYRYFDDEDIEKIIHISKYRKIGFGHEEIANILGGNIFQNLSLYENKMREIDKEIQRLQGIRHMIKDDINMMRNIREYGDDFFEMNSVHIKYISYKKVNQIKSGKNERNVLHEFLYDLLEIEFVYIIKGKIYSIG